MKQITSNEDGFTLVEMLGVLTIIALVFSVSALSLAGLKRGETAENLSRMIVRMFDSAHFEARFRGHDQFVEINVKGKVITSSVQSEKIVIPDAFSLDVETALEFEKNGNARIIFLPDGTSSGATLKLGNANGSATVETIWFTGLTEQTAHEE